ncbi:hypothetical protein [Streptomyces sp. NPDC006691]|uniref:hypothetical protein n=1 Tax=Streptomyces sp. NPDC006691 TaxID=3364757 RepID=UPI00367F90A7
MGSTGGDALVVVGRTGAACGAAVDAADGALPAGTVPAGVAPAGVAEGEAGPDPPPGVAEGAAGRLWLCGTAEGAAEPGWLVGAVAARCTAGLAPDPLDGAAAERGPVGRDPGTPPPDVTPDAPCPALPDGLAGLAGVAEPADGPTGMCRGGVDPTVGRVAARGASTGPPSVPARCTTAGASAARGAGADAARFGAVVPGRVAGPVLGGVFAALGGTTAERWIGGPMGLAGTGLSARAGGVVCGPGAGVARWTGDAGAGAAAGVRAGAGVGAGVAPGLDPSPRTGMASGAAGLGGTGRRTAGPGSAPVAGAGVMGAEGALALPGAAVEDAPGGVAVRCTAGMPDDPGERGSSRPLLRTGRPVSPCGASGSAGDTAGTGGTGAAGVAGRSARAR